MKKTMCIFAILGIAVLALGTASPALAAESLHGNPGNGKGGNGHHGDLGTGVPVEQNIALDGVLDDLIHENLATALGISPTELAARLDAGETVSQIGLSLGFDVTTISEILTQARAAALAQAVTMGLITQEQADWLALRGNQDPASYTDDACAGTDDCVTDGAVQSSMSENSHGKNHRR